MVQAADQFKTPGVKFTVHHGTRVTIPKYQVTELQVAFGVHNNIFENIRISTGYI